MTTKNIERGFRTVLLGLGAIVPKTDAEVCVFEDANKEDILKENRSLADFDAVLARGRQIMSDYEQWCSTGIPDGEFADFAMAAREGNKMPEHIREKMNKDLENSDDSENE